MSSSIGHLVTFTINKAKKYNQFQINVYLLCYYYSIMNWIMQIVDGFYHYLWYRIISMSAPRMA
jgi:hypothetical protein